MLKVKVTLKSFLVKQCPGNPLGTTWTCEYGMTPEGDRPFCAGTFPRIVHAMEALRYQPQVDLINIACGDPKKIMIYEVLRIKSGDKTD